LKRENVQHIFNFVNIKPELLKTICDGGLANESLFAIILYYFGQLNSDNIIPAVTHITDWTRMTSSTSPHLFKDANDKDILFIDNELKKNKYAIFIRKMSPEFPDDLIKSYIYKNEIKDDKISYKDYIKFLYIKNKYYIIFLFKNFFLFFLFCIFYNLLMKFNV
jgi:hypothetical protein